MSSGTGEILPGVWRFTAVHPDWDGDEDWDPEIAWWAIRTEPGLLLVDPLVDDWEALDALAEAAGGCAGIVRLMHFHQRSIAAAASRYRAPVWARPAPARVPQHPFDRALEHGETPTPGVTAFQVPRDDEVVLWLAGHRALLAGDVLLREADGTLDLCPESWVSRDRGRAGLRESLAGIVQLGAAHVLVCHGPLVLGDGRALERLVEPS
jgi:glyoxylase-like metal-dependent hydrolase (beta-lactamase superfamily II)